VLTGIHLGHYGLDFERDHTTQTEHKQLLAGNIRLSQLVERIMQIDGPFRVRVSSMEAVEVSDELIDLIRAFPKKLCPHLHLSMQSGSDEVLRRMRRRWPSGPFLERCEQIKAAIDHVALTTDVIVGFPGESESEFAETCAMVERIGFSKVHVFPFSPRENTEAATMPNQISTAEKERRVNHLLQLAERLRWDFAAGLVDQTTQMLVETQQQTQNDSVTLIGTSERYLRTSVCVSAARAQQLVGQLIDINVVASHGDELLAKI
jgi:threonylcarbamoyladenosine tRNA methylthiotransferase MtaB